MRQSKFHRDIDPLYDLWTQRYRPPNYWVLNHLKSTKEEALHILYTMQDIEEMHNVKFTEKQWKEIVNTFNSNDYQDVGESIDEIVFEVLGKSNDKDT